MRRTLHRRNDIFGDYLLVPHAADEDPGTRLLGYVVLEGDDTLHRAMRRNGDWRDHNARAFSKPIVAWYSLDKPDGSPLF